MTVVYQSNVSSSIGSGFVKLLFKWRGSIYKLIYRELAIFLALFAIISVISHHMLDPDQKRAFENIIIYCDTFVNNVPLIFILGFYVTYVANRWWQQFEAIPSPDRMTYMLALYVEGDDEYGRTVRRTLIRYLNLSLILMLRLISSAVYGRFPTLNHLVVSGFMTEYELELYESVPSIEFKTFWVPYTWFINLLKEAKAKNRLSDSQGLKIIMEEFNNHRSKCGALWNYNWVSIPLVYTQVVTLATYSFFAVALIGRQYSEQRTKGFQLKLDMYFPAFTVLQFLFFMGLLKVAEQLINPFGEDDEDFELNFIINRHTKIAYLSVDTLLNQRPPLVKDIFYDMDYAIIPSAETDTNCGNKVENTSSYKNQHTNFLSKMMGHGNKPKTLKKTNGSLDVCSLQKTEELSENESESFLPSQSFRRLSNSANETVVNLNIEEKQEKLPQQQDKKNSSITSAMADAEVN